jgi:hypothetical protein
VKVPFLKQLPLITRNQGIGNAFRDRIAKANPGSQIEQTFTIPSLSVRRVDVVTRNIIGIETKVGYTALTNSIKSQIQKDLALVQN